MSVSFHIKNKKKLLSNSAVEWISKLQALFCKGIHQLARFADCKPIFESCRILPFHKLKLRNGR